MALQVDGEAVRMNPSVIELSLLNQAKMLSKRKSGSKTSSQELRTEIIKVDVSKAAVRFVPDQRVSPVKWKEILVPMGQYARPTPL